MSVASVGFPVSPASMPVEFYGAVRNDAAAKPENEAVTASAVTTASKETASREARPLVIESAAQDLQKYGNAFNKKLQFVIDHQSNQVIVKVIDKETDKVIRELPPEELQRLHSNLREAFGLLFDEMV